MKLTPYLLRTEQIENEIYQFSLSRFDSNELNQEKLKVKEYNTDQNLGLTYFMLENSDLFSLSEDENANDTEPKREKSNLKKVNSTSKDMETVYSCINSPSLDSVSLCRYTTLLNISDSNLKTSHTAKYYELERKEFEEFSSSYSDSKTEDENLLSPSSQKLLFDSTKITSTASCEKLNRKKSLGEIPLIINLTNMVSINPRELLCLSKETLISYICKLQKEVQTIGGTSLKMDRRNTLSNKKVNYRAKILSQNTIDTSTTLRRTCTLTGVLRPDKIQSRFQIELGGEIIEEKDPLALIYKKRQNSVYNQ